MAEDIFSHLKYSGMCYPAAKVVERQTVLYRDIPDDEPDAEEQVWKVAVSGNGRPVSDVRPNGWWRSFAEINLDDEDAVTNWCRRKGDPFKPVIYQHTTTARWPLLKTTLRQGAAFYRNNRRLKSPSTMDGDPVAISAVLKELLQSKLMRVQYQPSVDEANGQLIMRPMTATLAAFLLASAAYTIHARLPMDTCAFCGDWFPIYRAGTRFCSTTCRAASSLAKGGA
ncbi:hypothetical protein SAMN04515648_3460 [Phyllobacterium sp. CL33Tsu]|uniref:hypothetical protein n=1 Tax=Phyllobacterium sp. CL33Tsu TaxID=1798191 RepID=UPI0008E3B8CF|nr:hypothetical protein [Phyllobacterium sp. CL33Tsu]SFJ31877.1 hypothetical protein SAMN04515648_3460 [Phyllobacterium sp. CL33Tsu]